ncbi:hypothetical protein [Congregibacter litoralis]|uniref:Transposase n=1 Tax=Congregibacter litoralis KT71 TaxID=314285 RepID=A4AC12_9GAMM|nr:hypothetical protein [Congregibacter litoralis]EAQ96462.1 hypothetical protein KT71_05542 [Congregibacter litoralis KT71]
MSKRQNTYAKIGADNAEKVKEWGKETPVSQMPTNQFGGVSRSKVCEMLGFSPSTVGSNIAISEAFDRIDERLAKAPSKQRKRTDAEVKALEKRIKHLESRVAVLQAENDVLKRSKAAEEFFLNNCRMIRA